MISKAEVAKGLGLLAEAAGRRVSPQQTDAFHAIVGELFTPDTWRAAVLEVGRSAEWPTPAAFVKTLKPEATALDAVAVAAFDAVDRCRLYSPERGEYYAEPHIRRTLGDKAADAFQAAGGATAFQSSRDFDISRCRERFVRAWCALATGERLQLGDGGALELGDGS